MPIVRRPGSAPDPAATSAPPPDPDASAPLATGTPPEHSLLPLQVPEDTTPTWELEMLVSGAVLVGLFQLAPLLTAVLAWVAPRTSTTATHMLAQLVVVFGRAAVYVLIAAFVTHLASRAYWVALVGLDSVFPRGVRWDRSTGLGPVTEGVVRERMPSLPTTISRLDNFCSIVFAVGFVAAFFILLAVVAAAALTVMLSVLAQVLPAWTGVGTLELVAFTLALLLVLPRVLDRRFGRYLAPESTSRRLLRAAILVSQRVTGRRLILPVLLTLRTNLRRGALAFVLVVLFAGASALSIGQLFVARGDFAPGAFPGLPPGVRAAARGYLHYADQRLGQDARQPVPFIQSDIVQGPYVRLFVPYDARADAGELKACLGRSAGAAVAVAERCLAAIHAVAVDGRVRPELDSRYYTDAPSGLQGLLVYIPVAGLPRGRNLLTVRRPPQPDDRGDLRPQPPDSIAFWL